MTEARVVFITGASSGIGRASALAFVKAGYHVAGMARRADRLQTLADEITTLTVPHGDFLPVVGDATQIDDASRAVSETVSRFGRLDILVANAGIGHRGAVIEANWHDLETLMRLNMDGVIHAIRACVPAMKQHSGGHIMTISSVASSMVSPYAATYAASKAFVSSLVASMRIELRKDNIKISDFLVGRTETEFNDVRLGDGARKKSRLPAMTAEQVADGLVRCAENPRNTVILRWFDRLIVWGNHWLPSLMGYFAARQYK